MTSTAVELSPSSESDVALAKMGGSDESIHWIFKYAIDSIFEYIEQYLIVLRTKYKDMFVVVVCIGR